ncbi:hypothetical protein BDY17DRAFT_322517 [Neohortaea acidophila]|uniref:F-box domain-containing protein n=1 Tax=Neohortaea acidophila TaxID=245834 RepID=A0A6A6Q0A9_9PEZI|nr:uncharacterized protein BDY17DRAFT_322517 [Neohortaea acidophila]KAF2485695.1 hypothetical protein BDY17DRAFT_322517 [Neohortaea acidophila]
MSRSPLLLKAHPSTMSFYDLPDEIVIYILWFLDVDALLATAKTSHSLRTLSLDPILHRLRLKYAHARVAHLLPLRPPLRYLQPPLSTIHLTRTHVAARKLHWSLVRIRLSRQLSRRPKLSSLISENKIPVECCKYDRRSGEFVLGTGVAGQLVERKRRVEREQMKAGLRVWLERKARDISSRPRGEGGVGVMVWRFSRKLKLAASASAAADTRLQCGMAMREPERDRVNRLRRFWEGIAA